MNFGQVPHWIYRDPKFRSLSPAAQGRYTWLLGHPGRSAVGHLQEWTAGLAQQLGLTHDEFIAELEEIRSAELIDYDTKSPTILFPAVHAWKRTPDQIKGWESALEVMWDTELRDRRLLELFEVAQERARESDKPESYIKAIPDQVLAAAQAAAPLGEGQEGATNRLRGRSADATTEPSEPAPPTPEEPASTLKPASSDLEAGIMPASPHLEASMKPASRSTDLRSEIGDGRSEIGKEEETREARASSSSSFESHLAQLLEVFLDGKGVRGRPPRSREVALLVCEVKHRGAPVVQAAVEKVGCRFLVSTDDRRLTGVGPMLSALEDEAHPLAPWQGPDELERLRNRVEGSLGDHPKIGRIRRALDLVGQAGLCYLRDAIDDLERKAA